MGMSAAEPVRVGLLSTAKINEAILRGARGSDRVEVVAVGSRDGGRAVGFAREHGIPRAHAGYDRLLEDDEVELVYIPLPNSLHVEWSVRALQAGKHVLCEKPLTRRPEEVEVAFEAAEAADRFLMEAFMYRHHPQMHRAAELVADGALGELRLIRGAFSFSLGRLDDIRMRPELEGGSVMDLGCYCVSAARLFAGEPESVFGEQVVGPTGIDVRFAAVLRFPGDVVAQFDCAFDLPLRKEIDLVGSEATLSFADPIHGRDARVQIRRGDDVEDVEVAQADPYRLELENLAAAIRGEGEPLLGREDARGQARTIEALYRSAAEGSAVRF
jgi:xylose dehydrogenase (NAD/NADP)